MLKKNANSLKELMDNLAFGGKMNNIPVSNEKTNPSSLQTDNRKKAIMLIILFGVVSLMGDIIYEGARGVYGPYTKSIGMDIALVGIITGVAEFLGYFVRLITGYLSDKTKGYWVFTIVGYFMLVSVPLLAISKQWQIVSLFIILERVGKAVRSPAKDTILSSATKQIGTGLGFAIHEALDQFGAIIGPLIFSAALYYSSKNSASGPAYSKAFTLMWIPFFLLIITVFAARIKVPHPENLEIQVSTIPEKLTKTFWLYNAFSITTTIGFISFVIIGYYFKDNNLLNDAQIPLLYSVAMGIDGAAALVVGKVYDNLKKRFNNERSGLRTLIVIPVLTSLIPFLAFTKNKVLLILSVLLWGIVMGTHETIMKSSIADLTHIKKRGTAYGIFNTGYGLALLISSSLIGLLYKVNIVYIYILVIVTQIISIIFYFTLVKSTGDRKNYDNRKSKV